MSSNAEFAYGADPAGQRLAAIVRRLVDATIRTTAGEDELAAAAKHVRAALTVLGGTQIPGSPGTHYGMHELAWTRGNPVIGQRNAVAPPVTVVHDRPGSARAEVVLGAAYEGPPGHVHGGVLAMLLDHIMGDAASHQRRRAATGTLQVRYNRGIRLGRVIIEANVVAEQDRKVHVEARAGEPGGGVGVEASGIFIALQAVSDDDRIDGAQARAAEENSPGTREDLR